MCIANGNATLNEEFEKIAAAYHERVSIVYKDKYLTYEELNNSANRYARVLRERGIVANQIVAVYMPRSLEMIIAIIAVLKAGAAYLPIDPIYPIDRIKFIMKDSGAYILMTNSEMVIDELSNYDNVYLDQECSCEDITNLSHINVQDDLAYTIYTSGTTGKPKGTLIEHHSVVDFIESYSRINKISVDDNWTLFHSICFDYSVWELFGALLNGCRLIIVPSEETKNTEALLKLMLSEKITIVNGTPQVIYSIYDAIESLNFPKLYFRIVTISGAALNLKRLKKFKEKYPDIQFVNSYGITETTVISTYKLVTDEDIEKGKTNIGKSISGVHMFLLDENKKTVDEGQIGEIAITGIGVARGYLNRKELNAEKFIYISEVHKEKLYLSGDLAYQNEDGEFCYIGRKDRQSKIRGFRIELAEIEYYILLYNGIRDVYVKSSDDNQLCAYLCYDDEINLDDLRGFLLKNLPNYMIPTLYYYIPSIPMNMNGKIDEAKLDAWRIEKGILHNDTELPRTNEEKVLYDTWSTTLEIKEFGVNDNFFMIGGDSIKIIQIVSKLKSKGYSINTKDFYTNSTISMLAKILKKVHNIVKINDNQNGELEMSGIQKYFFDKYRINPSHYNQSVIIKLTQGITAGLIRSFLNRLSECHPMLRASFQLVDGQYSQRINEKVNFDVKVINLIDKSINSVEVQNICNGLQSSIELEIPPLFKTVVISVREGKYLVMIVHHLIIDMVSFRNIMEELQNLYVQQQDSGRLYLQQENTTYRSWVKSLKQFYLDDKKSEDEKAYWRELSCKKVYKIKSELNGVNIVQEQAVKSFSLSEKDTEFFLTKLHIVYNTKINDILIAGLAMAFRDVFGTEGIMISVEGHGRQLFTDEIDIGRTIGWFTSIYPIYIETKDKSIEHIIKYTKEHIRNVPNEGLGYNVLQYNYGCSFNINPDIAFNYLGQFDNDISQLSFGEISDIAIGSNRAMNEKEVYKFEFTGMVINHRITITLIFSLQQFTTETIDRLMNAYEGALKEIIGHCKHKNNTEVTPSDLTFNKISIKELENFFN